MISVENNSKHTTHTHMHEHMLDSCTDARVSVSCTWLLSKCMHPIVFILPKWTPRYKHPGMDIYAHNFESTKTLPKHATPMQMRQLHWQNPREDAVALSIDNKIVRLCSFRAQMSTCTPIHNISCLQCSVCVRACVHRCIHMQIQPVHLPVLWLFCFILSPQIEFCLYNICLLVPQSGND